MICATEVSCPLFASVLPLVLVVHHYAMVVVALQMSWPEERPLADLTACICLSRPPDVVPECRP